MATTEYGPTAAFKIGTITKKPLPKIEANGVALAWRRCVRVRVSASNQFFPFHKSIRLRIWRFICGSASLLRTTRNVVMRRILVGPTSSATGSFYREHEWFGTTSKIAFPATGNSTKTRHSHLKCQLRFVFQCAWPNWWAPNLPARAATFLICDAKAGSPNNVSEGGN